MDTGVLNFINTKYTPEAKDLLYRAVGLFAVFNYSEPLGDIVDLVSMEGNIEDYTIVDGVRNTIEKGVDALVHANRIRLLPDVRFSEKMDLLEAVFTFTSIEKPENYLPFFSGWMSNEEIFARCLGECRSEPYERYFVMLAWVFEGTIKRFKEFLETLEIENSTVDFKILKDIRRNLLVFEQAFGSVPIVQELEEFNMLKAQPFDTYLDLLRDEFVDHDAMEDTVYALLFLALISEDGYKDPKRLLLERGKELFVEPTLQSLFNSMVTTALSKYLPAREVMQ